jgi:hypothetical protein
MICMNLWYDDAQLCKEASSVLSICCIIRSVAYDCYFVIVFIGCSYTDTKCDALFRFTDRMTQDERLPGREKDSGMGAGLLHR